MHAELEKTLAALLEKADLVTAEEWEQVLAIQKSTNKTIAQILEEKGIVAAQILAIISKIHLEADRLIEDAKRCADQMIEEACRQAEIAAKQSSAEILCDVTQTAMDIVAESLSEVMQADSQPWSDLERYVDELADIRQRVREEEAAASRDTVTPPTEDALPASALGSGWNEREDVVAGVDVTGEDLTIIPPTSQDALARHRMTPEEIVRRAEHLGAAMQMPQDGELKDVSREGLEEYFDGKIEVRLMPPVHVVSLLNLTKQLRDTPGIRILQSCGTWNEGVLMTLSLDQPLPLLDILRQNPALSDAKVVDAQEEGIEEMLSRMPLGTTAAGHTPITRIGVTLSCPDSGQETTDSDDDEESGD